MMVSFTSFILAGLYLCIVQARGPSGNWYYNIGGPTEFTDGIEFKSDEYVVKSPGTKIYRTKTNALTTLWKPIYATHRYMPDSKPMELSLYVRGGQYTVQLVCAEMYHKIDAVGKRQFKVMVNGKMWKSPTGDAIIDVFKVGGGLYKPIMLDIPCVDIYSGALDIKLIPVTENVFLNAVVLKPIIEMNTCKKKAVMKSM